MWVAIFWVQAAFVMVACLEACLIQVDLCNMPSCNPPATREQHFASPTVYIHTGPSYQFIDLHCLHLLSPQRSAWQPLLLL